MQVEQSFRDFKTHLGLRGLKLKVDIAPRTGRLLLGFLIAYTLAILLGSLSESARKFFEIPRKKPRHGTSRTLSVLTLAMNLLSHPVWRYRSYLFLLDLVHRIVNDYSTLPNKAPP